MARISNKVAVVTGASKDVGAGIARRLAAQGASTAVNWGEPDSLGERIESRFRTSRHLFPR
jgi:3-oxoacyl-[acyl-carrier protein] reductase